MLPLAFLNNLNLLNLLVNTTSNFLIKDQARALSTLRRLKLLGVKIAMDDFGTGHASLSS
jgi:EAL domain-containing protein (putative c-di-GMP-specific phosphodiesterase class I)